MGLKDLINNIRERKREKKQKFIEAEEDMRIQEMLEERKKSANERELEKFMKKEREEKIKLELDKMRKKEARDINFNHNPLDVPNVISHAKWEILKEKNMFKNNSNMFFNNEFIFKNNPNLLKNNMRLLR